MTTQPEWELVYATDHTALYRDKTGAYPPELAVADTIDIADDDIEATAAIVHRFPLERCWKSTWGLITVDPQGDHQNPIADDVPWFADSVNDIARSSGIQVQALIDMLCCEDPADLANAYSTIGAYHGFDNFDSEPQEWTASEFATWPERGPKLSADERDAFTEGYVSCALWCGVLVYKHDDDCPCHEPAASGEAYDADDCTCDAEMVSSDDSHDESELSEDARSALVSDAEAFYEDNIADIRASGLDMERAGHDFWLTRNRHGAGFWDEKARGADADAALDRLTDASHAYGEQSLVQNPGMKITIL